MELLLHPMFECLRSGRTGAVAEPVGSCGKGGAASTEASLPACGLLAAPAKPTEPVAAPLRSPFEQALLELARRRFSQSEPPSERQMAHTSPF